MAATKGCTEIMDILLKNGADPNLVTKVGGPVDLSHILLQVFLKNVERCRDGCAKNHEE